MAETTGKSQRGSRFEFFIPYHAADTSGKPSDDVDHGEAAATTCAGAASSRVIAVQRIS